MNKSESKYYNTALLMNQALIELLNKKEYEFITVKEICEKAGVHRSTFYLHYETIADLLEECIENANKQFAEYFSGLEGNLVQDVATKSKENLIFITPEYLTPYLTYIRENKTLFQVSVKCGNLMRSAERFNTLNKCLFKPVCKKFGIDDKTEEYLIAYYLNGVYAIINEWIKNGCKDDIDYIENIIISCVRPTLSNVK